MSTDVLLPRWPPRSPHEALISSPSGRHRMRQYPDRTSPSPSPLKKNSTTPNLYQLRSSTQQRCAIDKDEDEDEDEDEETLQLRLETLQAQLKLKQLRRKKAKATASPDAENVGREETSPLKRARTILGSREHPQHRHEPRPRSSTGVQIPVSPPRKLAVAEQAQSPGRVLLGIDKGLKGRNVSLRRPPPGQKQPGDDDPFGGYMQQRRLSTGTRKSTVTHANLDKPKSFSERIAETRRQDKDQKEKERTLREQRSTGFGVPQIELDAYKRVSVSQTEIEGLRNNAGAGSGGFSREEVLKAISKPIGGLMHRSNTLSGVRNTRRLESSARNTASSFENRLRTPTSQDTEPRKPERSQTAPSSTVPPCTSPESKDTILFEPFSSLHLSKRILPHPFLTRTLSQKSILLLPNLLATVKSPDFALPDSLENDYVVFGIIASKSSPLSHKDSHKSTPVDATSMSEAADAENNARGKYMVLTLTDLKWSLDLFLFTTAYTRFWKLTPGTIVAILNPSIMPPPPGKSDTGRFSLVLSSSDDTVLEVGTSRDLGWCKSVRKDGKGCASWVDKRHTEFCEFHVNRVVEKTKSGRMEVNSMSAPFGPGGKRTGFWGGRKKPKDDGLVKEGVQYDRGTGSKFFIGTTERSAASLLDAEGLERGGSREERIRKRLAEREKEKEIARKLGQGGNGMGGEYLRLRNGGDGPRVEHEEQLETVDAGSLGLLGNKARDVHLSPIKKRKASARVGENARKKTRFVTDRGIKEAGRESFGVVQVEDGDDDLDIV